MNLAATLVFGLEAIPSLGVQGGITQTALLRHEVLGRLRQQRVVQISEKEGPILKKSSRNLHKGFSELQDNC